MHCAPISTKNSTELETLGSFEDVASRIPIIDLLRGRDGLPGRDGERGPQGERGPPGPQGDQGSPGPRSAGVTYIRWGKSSCPNTPGTQPVYAGRAGGTAYANRGGGAEKLCLPDEPEYINGAQSVVTSHTSTIHGAEYQTHTGPISNRLNQNVPCAVCHASTRETMIMIPAKIQCPPSWTREYYGYLMTEFDTIHHYRSSFNCIDVAPDTVTGEVSDTNGALFYHVVASCPNSGLECDPYKSNQAISCTVCTK